MLLFLAGVLTGFALGTVVGISLWRYIHAAEELYRSPLTRRRCLSCGSESAHGICSVCAERWA
jgi:hypothetical protein